MQLKSKRKTETRMRLLQAGGEIFAQYGFRGATVRRIARKANANVAAVILLRRQGRALPGGAGAHLRHRQE